MSAIRFIHADFLRLGTPLRGLADSPSWLQQLATGAVRQAVRNIIDLAISRKTGFLLVAGSVVEDNADLQSAARWLHEEFEQLRSRGIAVVSVAKDAETRSILAGLCDIVLHPGQSLQVTHSGGDLQLNVVSEGHTASGGLLISVGEYMQQADGRFAYQARPSLTASTDCNRTGRDGHLSLSAGAVQSVSKDEARDHGCIVVEADFLNYELRSEFCACDVVRFHTESVLLPGAASVQSLASEIVRACESIDRDTDQTVVVDWLLQSNVATDLRHIEQLNEVQLLSQLRDHLHSGHRGIWPRRVAFSDSAIVSVTSDMTPVVEEYTDLLAETVQYHDAHGSNHQLVSLGQGCPAKPELLSGLTFLSRVA